MASHNASSNAPASAKAAPKDAQLMASILKDMGVTEYEPKVINQMLEFTYRYVTDILDEAKAYSSHANKKTVDCDDVALAVHSKMDNSFTTPPPRELLLELARTKNSQPLPLIKQGIGPRLPPDRFCFLAPNFRVKSSIAPGPSNSAASTGILGATSRGGFSSSLQASAIQAALGSSRKSQASKTSSSVGAMASTATLMAQTNKTVARPPVNLMSSGIQQQQHGSVYGVRQTGPMGIKRKMEDD